MIRKHRRPEQDSDLDITAFMNLMIVLVPILLINLIFAQTSVIELNFPESQQDVPVDPEQFDLRVAIYKEGVDVMEGNDTLIKHVANRADGIDQEQLSVVMQEIKKRVPDERGVSLLAMPDTSYQSIVAVMDSVSSYKTVVAGSVVRAELFPDISIADAPSERLKGTPQL